MQFSFPDKDTYRISHLDLLFAEFLKNLPFEASPDSDSNAKKRLFGDPIQNPDDQDQQFLEDWREYVQPDLEHLFRSARETVARDLRNISRMDLDEEQTPHFQLDILRSHRDAWLSTLNQARLVIAERHGWANEDEARQDLLDQLREELDDEPDPDEKTTQDFRRPRNHAQQLARIQMDFYMVLQELMIEDARLESEDEPYALDPSGESEEAFSPIDLAMFSDDADDEQEDETGNLDNPDSEEDGDDDDDDDDYESPLRNLGL